MIKTTWEEIPARYVRAGDIVKAPDAYDASIEYHITEISSVVYTTPSRIGLYVSWESPASGSKYKNHFWTPQSDAILELRVDTEVPDPTPLTFEAFRIANETRKIEWQQRDGASPWTGADWSNEMCGEVGEAANIVKKLRRIETNVKSVTDGSKEELLAQLADELADVFITADLVGQFYNIDLNEAVTRKFNATSKKQGLKTVLPKWRSTRC